jgi:hypothetical protein
MEGMLLQEYVADMLEVRIPEGWEESVRNAYGRDPDEHPEGDEDRGTHISDGSESEDKANEEESEGEEDSGDDYEP